MAHFFQQMSDKIDKCNAYSNPILCHKLLKKDINKEDGLYAENQTLKKIE